MSDASADTALLDQDTEVLREVFDATGGRESDEICDELTPDADATGGREIELTDVTADGLRSDGCAGCCCCSELMYELCRPRPEEETEVVGREMDDTGVALAVAVATGGREIDDTAVAVGRCGAYWEYGFIAGCAASRA